MLLNKFVNRCKDTETYSVQLRDEFNKEMNGITYNNLPIIFNPEESFNHLTSNYTKDGKRTFNEERAKYILSIPKIIKECKHDRHIMEYKESDRDILFNLEPDNEYIIVLKEENNKYLLITGYNVTWDSTLKDIYFNRLVKVSDAEMEDTTGHFYTVNTKNMKLVIGTDLYNILVKKKDIKDIIRMLAEVINRNIDEAYLVTRRFQQHMIKIEPKKVVYFSTVDDDLSEFVHMYYEIWSNFSHYVDDLKSNDETLLPNSLIKVYERFNKILITLVGSKSNKIVDFKRIENLFFYKFSYNFPALVKEKYKNQFKLLFEALNTSNEVLINEYNIKYKSKKDKKDIIYVDDKGYICLDRNKYNKYVDKYIMCFFTDFEKQVLPLHRERIYNV